MHEKLEGSLYFSPKVDKKLEGSLDFNPKGRSLDFYIIKKTACPILVIVRHISRRGAWH